MNIRRLSAAIAMGLVSLGTSAGVASAEPTPATISVVGRADLTKAPDTAIVSADIVTNADNPQNAAALNGKIEDRVVGELVRAGISANAARTTGYRSVYVARPEKIADPRERYGYVVTRSIEIEVAPPRIDVATRALTAAGVDEINDVRTSVRDRGNAVRDLYDRAVADAQTQAQALARAAHLRIVRVKSIDASSFTPAPIVAFAEAAPAKRIGVQNATLSASVNATFEVEPQATPGYLRPPAPPAGPRPPHPPVK